MNIRLYVLFLLPFYIPCMRASKVRHFRVQPRKQNISKNYWHSLATGTVIGSLTGASSSFLDRYTPFGNFIPFTWMGWHFVRNEFVNSIAEDMEKKAVHVTIMSYSAWVASWLVYIAHAQYLGVGINQRA